MSSGPVTTVGVISDTHGDLTAAAVEALTEAGAALIIHAGDVGGPDVLLDLEAVAPVVAVRGNTDNGVWAHDLPDTARIEVGGVRIAVAHAAAPGLEPDGASVVIGGHTHIPSIVRRRDVLYVNPGSATHPRTRGGVPSIALIDVHGGGDVRARIVLL
jgi:uncharacterized protein